MVKRLIRRRRPRVSKRGPKRVMRVRRQPRINNKFHFFKKKGSTEDLINLNGSTSLQPYVSYTNARTFQFDQIQSYADLTSIYDRYQIKAVGVRFTWSPSVMKKDGVNNIIGANNSLAPHLRYKVDYDDAGATSWDILGADARTKSVRILPNRPVTVLIRPKVLIQMYKSLTATGYGPKRSPMIDTADYNVPHYGLKYALRYPNLDSGESVADSNLGQVMIEYTYYVKMGYPQT